MTSIFMSKRTLSDSNSIQALLIILNNATNFPGRYTYVEI